MSTKSIFRSKTFWVQAVAMASMVFPQAREFFSNNPVEVVTLISAVNIIVRFATKGEVGLTISLGRENGGGGSGWTPLLVTMAGLAASGMGLPALVAL